MMYKKSLIEKSGTPDREKSRSSLSLLWEEIYGPQIDLQDYVESCWNNLKTVDIDLEVIKPLELTSVVSKPHLQDSGTSSLNDEEQSVLCDKDTEAVCKPSISVKTFVEHFSQGVTYENETGKWNLVVRELLDTESAYLSSLKEVDEGYLKMFTNKSHDIDEINIIFSNWKKLRLFHSQFLAQIKLATSAGFKGLKRLAQCFINDAYTFEELYSAYCTNYSKSIRHLSEIEQGGSDVWQYLVECQVRLGHQLPLSTFLLKPVQRILKYQLLLRELIHSCNSVYSKEAPDIIKSLLQAIEEMINVASRINERQTEQEEIARLILLRNELYAEIISYNPAFPQLGFPFHDGELKVPGSRNPRVALLCQQALVLAKRVASGRWDIKQVIKCEKMMLFEYIPKQPLGFYMVDLNNPKSKSTVLALTKEDKDLWCNKIKELILGSYDAGLISDRAKRILLENKHNALAMTETSKNTFLENHQVKLEPEEEELLDLETTLRHLLDPSLENRFTTTKNLSVKRRNSVGVDKIDLKTNFRDPSIYQKTNRRCLEVRKDIDCRSITVDVNEEVLREGSGGVLSMQLKTYERYIEVARTKIRLTPDDIEEIFLPLRQLSMPKDNSVNSPAPLADIEMVAFCSDQESTISDRPVQINRHRKTASMDRNYGMSVVGKAGSYAHTCIIDYLQAEDSSDNIQRKKPLFSSVRGTKATRSNSEWCGTIESEIRPGIVKSISRLFRASSKFGKRDKSRNISDIKPRDHHMSNIGPVSTNPKVKITLNKSNSTDHIVQPQTYSPNSNLTKKSRAPQVPSLSQISKVVQEELEDGGLLHPIKPPRKSLHSRVGLFSKSKSSSSDGIKSENSSSTDLNFNDDLDPAVPSSESSSPYKVKDLVYIFQSSEN